jgi:hypothetical protein
MNSITDQYFGLPRLPRLPETIEKKLLFLANGARSQLPPDTLIREGREFLETLSSPAELNAQALTKFFLYQLPSRLTQNAMFHHESTNPKLEKIKRKISSVAILAILFNEPPSQPNNIPDLLVFRESLKTLFKTVTDLDGANEALEKVFEKYPLLDPDNQAVLEALNPKTVGIFRNFKASTYDVFNSPLEEITSLPTLLAKTLTSLMPDTNKTQNNKQKLINTIES